MSNRRKFIKQLSVGSALGLASTSPLSFATEKSRPLKNRTANLFANVPKHYPKRPLRTEGHWPQNLTGALYRNSPAMISRQGFQHSHLFDGDGMIQKFTIEEGTVHHQGKMVATDKYLAEEKADRFIYHGLGSSPPNPQAARNNDSANPANISVRKMGDKFFALWEAGSAYEIDPDTLETHGRVDWGEDLKHLPFSAHPLRDKNGDWWNIGSWIYSGQARTIIYQLDPQAKLKRVKVIPMRQAGYMHAFTLSQRFLILVNTAQIYKAGERYFDSFHFDSQGKTEIVLLDKNDLTVFKTIEVPANFVFHFGNAFELGNELHISMAEYKNADVMSKGLGLGPTSAFAKDAVHYQSELNVYRINLKSGRWSKTPSQLSMEFPNFRESRPFDAQTIIGKGRGIFSRGDTSATFDSTHKQEHSHDHLLSFHPMTQEQERFSFGKEVTIEEPLFINAKDGQEYILHTLGDRDKQRSGIALFKSGNINSGPIATAWADELYPFGFHGCFVPS